MTGPRSLASVGLRAGTAALFGSLILLLAAFAPRPATDLGPARRTATETTSQESGGQEETAPVEAPEPSIVRVASQTAWVGADGEFVLRLAVDPGELRRRRSSPSPVTIDVTVHSRVTSRSAFQETLEGNALGGVVAHTDAALDELARDPAGARIVRFQLSDGRAGPAGAPAATPAPGRAPVTLAQEGVYPVVVRVLDQGTELDELVTHVVRVPDTADVAPLATLTVVPVHATTSLQPNGSVVLARSEIARLARITAALQVAAPVVLAPTPETLDALAASDDPAAADVLAGLRAIAQRGEVLVRPYVPLDPMRLVAGGTRAELTAALIRGADTIVEHLGVRPPARTWLADTRLDTAALGALRAAGIDQMLVPDALLTPIELNVTLTRPFVIEADLGRSMRAATIDAGLAHHVAPTDDPGLAAHQLLADLAVLFFDEPSLARGVVLALPDDWDPTPGFADALLAGLEVNPTLTPADVEQLLTLDPASGAGDEPLVRTFAPPNTPPELPDPTAAAARALRADVRGFASMVDAATPVLADFDRRLLAAQALDLTADERTAHLAGLAAAIDAELALIDVPERRAVTLTAREAEIPVTLRSRAPYPVKVEVDLASPKLLFPDGSRQVVTLTDRSVTVPVRVEARTSGTFPLSVTVRSPDGTLTLGDTRYTIRSTAVSGVGLLVSGGALLFLVAWWGLHLRHSRARDDGGVPRHRAERPARSPG